MVCANPGDGRVFVVAFAAAGVAGHFGAVLKKVAPIR
jgi:hypothetical protein